MGKMLFETVAERLIVAVDFRFDSEEAGSPREQAQEYLHHVVDSLEDVSATLKINTIARILGATAVEFIHDNGFKCFLDLKLFDIGNTLLNDAAWIHYYAPAMLTVSARIKPAAFDDMQSALPETLILPVDPLTDLNDADFRYFGYTGRRDASINFFDRIWQNRAKGAICAPTDIELIPSGFRENATIITPGVQSTWMQRNDNSVNALTPRKAIEAGADAVVMGRGITGELNMHDAALHTISEIETALKARA